MIVCSIRRGERVSKKTKHEKRGVGGSCCTIQCSKVERRWRTREEVEGGMRKVVVVDQTSEDIFQDQQHTQQESHTSTHDTDTQL